MFKKYIVPYLFYILLFIGTGFISGAIVHFPINPLFFIGIGIVGVICFTIGFTVQEREKNAITFSTRQLLKTIFLSIILSLGIGMISGGIQHFEQYPTYARVLIPVGFLVSFLTFTFKQKIQYQIKEMTQVLLCISIFTFFVWYILGHIIATIPASSSEHTHGNVAEQQDAHHHTSSNDAYHVDWISDVKNLKKEQSYPIQFSLSNEDHTIVKGYQLTHEKLLHLIIVSKDLAQFQHLHPEYDEHTGLFTVPMLFPKDGSYRLFFDFLPKNSADTTPKHAYSDLKIGEREETISLNSLSESAYKDGGYTFSYVMNSGKPIYAGQHVSYALNVEKDGATVNTLEPYLGALGHSVIIKENTLEYLHTHAVEGMSSGPVEFMTTFPTTGLYKIFTQVQIAGKVYTVEKVVSVKASETPGVTEDAMSTEHMHMGH